MDKFQQKMEGVQIPAGYTVAAGLGSSPLWLNQLDFWLGIIAVLFAIAVGATTLWLNLIRIKKHKKNQKNDL